MRRKRQKQIPLAPAAHGHPHAKELEAMAIILDEHPEIAELALGDLVAKGVSPDLGAPGLTADFVVRAAVLKQMLQFSYARLAFAAVDSIAYRKFLELGLCDVAPTKSALQSNIKMLRASTWEAINKVLVAYASPGCA